MLVLVQGLGTQGVDGLLVKELTQLEPSSAAGSALRAPFRSMMKPSRCGFSRHSDPALDFRNVHSAQMAFTSLCKVVVCACMCPLCMFAWFVNHYIVCRLDAMRQIT